MYQEFRNIDACDGCPLVVIDHPNGHASGGTTDGNESITAARQDHTTCNRSRSQVIVTLYCRNVQ